MTSTRHSLRALAALAAALLGAGLLITGPAAATSAHGYTVSLGSFGARCDGQHDDKAALEAALADVHQHGGGTLVIPTGTCRIVQTAASSITSLQGPITLRGATSAATLSLDTDAPDRPGDFRELFGVTGPDVHLENFQLTRSSDVYSVFLDNYGTDGLRLDRMVINGRKDVFPVQYVEGLELSPPVGEVVFDTKVTNSTFTNVNWGIFQANPIPGTTKGFVVDHSTFKHNYADDLEFNAPSATMTEITVTNNSFSDNQYSAPEGAAGVGVGMANAQYVKVAHNTFDGYFYSPIHIEDRSANIDVIDNHFANSFKLVRNYASMVFIINDSHFVTVRHNVFDSSGNTNEVWCVYAGAGGGVAPPSYVTITDNTFLLRPNAHVIGNYDAGHVVLERNIVRQIP